MQVESVTLCPREEALVRPSTCSSANTAPGSPDHTLLLRFVRPCSRPWTMPVAAAEESTGQQPVVEQEQSAAEGAPESRVGAEPIDKDVDETQEGEERNDPKARSW